jgi:hypothetical protein
MILFVAGLVASGITAFPLLREIRILHRLFPQSNNATVTEFPFWIAIVKSGLEETYSHYPWIAYGTDWLAFGHLAIAFFFIAALARPAQSRLILNAGIAACVSVIPLALICGQVREIPFGWRLIDCSFGLVGIVPLIYCLRLLRHMED